MQSLFIGKDDEFVVDFVVATDEQGTIWCDIKEDVLKEMLSEEKEYEIKHYSATFRQPSFHDTIDLYDDVFSITDSSSLQVNPLMARYKKIVLLIKNWDLTDKEGNKISPTEENIRNLHPFIASVIGIKIDLETGGLLT